MGLAGTPTWDQHSVALAQGCTPECAPPTRPQGHRPPDAPRTPVANRTRPPFLDHTSGAAHRRERGSHGEAGFHQELRWFCWALTVASLPHSRPRQEQGA